LSKALVDIIDPKISRVLRLGSLGPRVVRIRQWYWTALDWLIEEYNFPVTEMIDDLNGLYDISTNDVEFNQAFEESISIAYSAQLMARHNLANDNFLTAGWTSSERLANVAKIQAQRNACRRYYAVSSFLAKASGVPSRACFYCGDYIEMMKAD